MRGQMPTKANIIAGLKWLAEGAQAGDVLFFSYSGHGCQEEDPEGEFSYSGHGCQEEDLSFSLSLAC